MEMNIMCMRLLLAQTNNVVEAKLGTIVEIIGVQAILGIENII